MSYNKAGAQAPATKKEHYEKERNLRAERNPQKRT